VTDIAFGREKKKLNHGKIWSSSISWIVNIHSVNLYSKFGL